MPRDYVSRLSPEQLDLVVAYLLTLTDSALLADGGAGSGQPAPKVVPAGKYLPPQPPTRATLLMVQVLVVLFVFILTLFLLFKLPGDEK